MISLTILGGVIVLILLLVITILYQAIFTQILVFLIGNLAILMAFLVFAIGSGLLIAKWRRETGEVRARDIAILLGVSALVYLILSLGNAGGQVESFLYSFL